MYQCCIFDLDGTIINTVHSLAHTISLTMKHFGYENVDEAHTKVFVGDGYEKFVERALIYSGDTELIHYEEALKVYSENFKKYCLYQVEAYPGMVEFLTFLKDKKIPIGVLTNKGYDRAVECVEEVYGKGFFDVIMGDGQGVKLKPDPEGALLMAERLGAIPSQCLYFGDTNTDMITGKNAGMDTVGVTWGFRDEAELRSFEPKYIISHPDEIQQVI